MAAAYLAGCSHEQPEVVEVRTWDEGCYRARGAGPLPPDTIAYPPGRRSEFRVVALGGCVDAEFYDREREIYSVLDSLIVPGTETAWPFNSWATLYVRESDSTATPHPLDHALTVILADTTSFHFWQFGFTPEFGLLWIEGHHGPNSRLASVERTTGGSVAFEWPDPDYPFGGPSTPLTPRDREILDSLDAAMDH